MIIRTGSFRNMYVFSLCRGPDDWHSRKPVGPGWGPLNKLLLCNLMELQVVGVMGAAQ
jgi:hypothetical protein